LRVQIESKSLPTDRGELQVLGQTDLSPGAREIIALVGPSDCGKTTLLRIIGGLEPRFQGTVDWLGTAMPRIGTVFQEPRLLPWRTVRQNLLLARQTANHGWVDALLQTMDLDAFRDALPATLSLGMARRLAIARVLSQSSGRTCGTQGRNRVYLPTNRTVGPDALRPLAATGPFGSCA
jgi:NitT/TauT family transport system ATP-binding protein